MYNRYRRKVQGKQCMKTFGSGVSRTSLHSSNPKGSNGSVEGSVKL